MISLLQNLIVQWTHFLETGHYFYEISKKLTQLKAKVHYAIFKETIFVFSDS